MVRRGFFIVLLLMCGCAGTSGPVGPDVIFLIPGVDGDGPRYARLRDGFRDAGISQCIQTVDWGAPRMLFFLNFSNESIHRDAEMRLASHLQSWRAKYPNSKMDLVGHSAGCGVAVGALSRLPNDVHVSQVILLAPSVSPTYSLAAALDHIDQKLDVFFSDRDTLFLSWRTRNFGTYDNIKTRAAGNCGFELSSLSSHARQKITQHPYDASWKKLGNDGGHFGATARKFARQELAPLLFFPWGRRLRRPWIPGA